MKLEGPSPLSQEPATCLGPEINLVHGLPTDFFKIKFHPHLRLGLPSSLFFL